MANCLSKIDIYLKTPIDINGETRYVIQVPCGKCARCIERRKMEWAFRMGIEMRESKTALFVTLTYDPKTVPYNKYGIKTLNNKVTIDNNTGEIKGGDLTNFLKRLRINQTRSDITWEHYYNRLRNDDKIKYFAAGEYGEERGRPHYHLIIFNTSIKTIEKSWKLGQTHIVPANEQTIAYVMKYLDKHIGKKQDKRKEPEFNTMSEGIGLSYVFKNKKWHKQNPDILYVTNQIGIKIPMPKYYRLKMFNEDERIEQMKIVTTRLEELQQEGINELGAEQYWIEYWDAEKASEKRFRKKIKKRIQD